MITLDHEATIHFNGEPIRLIPVPGGHTRGDLVVHFTASKVLCLGDLVLSGTFPNADPGRGGDAQQLLAVLKQLRESLPADTLLVPAHGANIDTAGLSEYISMVTGTTAAVKGRMKEGRTLDEIMAQNPLTPWAAFEDAERGLGYENWIRELHASLSGKSQTSINAPVTAAYVDQGIEAAIATRRQQREATAAAIPADLLKRYERVRANKGGIAVATVRKERCSGCMSPIPAQRILEVDRQDHLYLCEACGRILTVAQE